MYRIVEPCCASAAFSYYMMGAQRTLAPSQGSKWRHRRELALVAYELGFEGKPGCVFLNDLSPWPIAHLAVNTPKVREEVLMSLESMNRQDPKAVFDSIHKQQISSHLATFAAEFLFLTRLSFSGKAVSIKDGCWRSPGFNKTSAYGCEGPNFGKVNPMVPSLIKAIRALESIDITVNVDNVDAFTLDIDQDVRTLVYLDPDYVGTTGYASSLSRERAVELCLRAKATGASVMYSEGEPIEALTSHGWKSKLIHPGRKDSSRFRGKQEEWVTFA